MREVDIEEVITLFNNASEGVFGLTNTIWFNKSTLSLLSYNNVSLYCIFSDEDKRNELIKKNISPKIFIEIKNIDLSVIKIKLKKNNIYYKETNNYFFAKEGEKTIIVYKMDKLYIPYYVKGNINSLFRSGEREFNVKLIKNIIEF